MPNTTYWMIHIFGDSTMIKSFASSFQILRSKAITMDQLGQPEKCLIAGSSPLFSKMPINSSLPANDVKEQGWP
ncbi:hypothetical protein CR513_40763, partial [Mucuna pruriens]